MSSDAGVLADASDAMLGNIDMVEGFELGGVTDEITKGGLLWLAELSLLR
jgi:hypothetical protein